MNRIECPLTTAASSYSSAPAILEEELCLNYEQLHDTVSLATDRCRQIGIEAGQRVGIQSDNSWRLVAALWALFRIQATACLFSPRWPAKAVDVAHNRLLTNHFVDETALAKLVQHAKHEDRSSAIVVDSGALATIVFSSGSTSQPKAIAHDLNAHLVSAAGSNENLPVEVGDRWLLALPLHHVSGLGVAFRCCLAGAQIVMARPNESVQNAIERLQASHVSLVPTQLKQLRRECAKPPASLRAVLLGGSSWPVELVRNAVEDGWPIFTTYGLSEMASQVTTTHATTSGEQVGTCGRTLAGRELMVSESGEILVRGNTLFRGYVEGSELHCPLDDCGWFHTGDLGQLDRLGYLTVQGRKDNMFISGGENIYPEEIEARLLEIDSVRQATVVAIADERFGQRPVAFVDAAQLQPEAWCELLGKHLPRFKLPDRFLPWPKDVPRGVKVGRPWLAQRAEDESR